MSAVVELTDAYTMAGDEEGDVVDQEELRERLEVAYAPLSGPLRDEEPEEDEE